MENDMYKKKAFAFSITLWIIASLLFATVVILRFAKDEVNLSKGLNNKLQSQIIAQSILELLKFYIPTADYTSNSIKNNLLKNTNYPLPSEIIVDGREYNITKNITISLIDTSGMVNIMYASGRSIANTLSYDENSVTSLTDTFEDWIDVDNLKRINGAEQNNYSKFKGGLKVRNSKSIQDIHELQLIKGFDKIDFDFINKNIYYGRDSSINLMLINNKRYLSFLLGLDIKSINEILELRDMEPLKFIKRVNYAPKYNDDYMGLSLSKEFIIKIKVEQDRGRTLLSTLLSFEKILNKPYMTISYSIY
jgi:general secretion pathway protein K